MRAYLSQKMHAHPQAYTRVHAEVQKIASYPQDTGWQGVEGDIAALVGNREAAGTAFEYLYRAIDRLDEIDAGRDLIVEHVKGKHPVLNQDTGIVATGQAVHKGVESYVKVVRALAKTYAASPRIDMGRKKAQVLRLFEKGLDAHINEITETINHTYVDDNELTAFLKATPWGKEGAQPQAIAELERNTEKYLKHLNTEAQKNG